MKLKQIVDKQLIRDKFRFLSTTSELTKYVPLEELATIVGGNSPIQASAYEF